MALYSPPATAVVDVPRAVEIQARKRAIRADEKHRLEAKILDDLDVTFDLVLYHPADVTRYERAGAQLAIAATLSF